MQIINKVKLFKSEKDLNLEEYIYLINYSYELINKFEQGLLNLDFQNISLLVIHKQKEDLIIKYIINILENLRLFKSNINFDSNIPIFYDFYNVLITDSEVNSDISITNQIYLNNETIPIIFAISYILALENISLQKYQGNIIQATKTNINMDIFKNFTLKIINNQQYISFLQNKETIQNTYLQDIDNLYIPIKQIFFTVMGLIIIMVRKM